LGANDHFSYSRFGSDILHDFPSMLSAQPSVIERASALVDVTDANLGGTEIEKALHSTFALKGGGEGADVLLITDGEVWDIEKVIKLAQKSVRFPRFFVFQEVGVMLPVSLSVEQ
jgi:Ca-activated chloride channel family protein